VNEENTCVEWPRGKASTFPIRADIDESITGLHSIAEHVHYYGARIATQLQHVGGQTTLVRTENVQPYAPSAIPMKGDLIPKEMTCEDIKNVIRLFADTAERTKKAGFDCVEIHGAHGYLVSQFLSPVLNQRHDAYGGNLKGRVRFAVELVDAIRKRVGDDFPIIFRLNGSDRVSGGVSLEDVKYVARALEEAGVSAISVSSGLNSLSRDWVFPIEAYPRGCNVEFSRAIKSVVHIPIGVAGRIDTPDFAEEIISSEAADYIVIGRPLIADPDWANKAFWGVPERIRPCLYCNHGCTGYNHRGWRLSCDINSEAGRELDWQRKPTPIHKLHIGVVGGGPAGVEAACRARFRGHDVELFEKKDQLGGQLQIAGIPEHKKRIAMYVQFLSKEVIRLGVTVHYSTRFRPELLEKYKLDGLIIATGAVCLTSPNIKGVNYACSAWEVLQNGVGIAQKVMIVGGGHVGIDTAIHLSTQNPSLNITVVEMKPQMLPDPETEPSTRKALLKILSEKNIETLTSTTLDSIYKDRVIIKSNNQIQEERPVDLVILALGALSYIPEELKKINNFSCPVLYIGDCVRPKRIWEATHEGSHVILKLENLVALLKEDSKKQ